MPFALVPIYPQSRRQSEPNLPMCDWRNWLGTSTMLHFSQNSDGIKVGWVGITHCPAGTSDNSPALQRWVWPPGRMSPAGTAENRYHSAVPAGLGRDPRHTPALRHWAIFKHPSGMKPPAGRSLFAVNLTLPKYSARKVAILDKILAAIFWLRASV